jgi:chaperonin GroEL
MLATKQQVIIVGDVSGAALDTLIGAISQGKVDGMVVPPPAYGQDGHDYFEDIAIYTGANLWLENMSFKDLKPEDLGTLKSARVSRDKAILFGNNETGDAIAGRIAAIEQQLARPDMTPSLKEQLDERRAKLAGKVAIIRVGAVTEAAREELFYRVEDAVEACKSALSSGIVAGGATTLLFASQDQRMTPKEAKEAGYSGGGFGDGIIKLPTLEPFIKEALQAPIRLLFANAAEDGGYYLNKILEAGYGKGYNLREIGKEPEDLYKSGIVDPTKVVLQTVENAFENAGQLLTTGAVITDEVADEAKTNS